MKITKEQLKQIIKEEFEAVTERCWDGYERNPNVPKGQQGSCRKKGSVSEEVIDEKKKKKKKKKAKKKEPKPEPEPMTFAEKSFLIN